MSCRTPDPGARSSVLLVELGTRRALALRCARSFFSARRRCLTARDTRVGMRGWSTASASRRVPRTSPPPPRGWRTDCGGSGSDAQHAIVADAGDEALTNAHLLLGRKARRSSHVKNKVTLVATLLTFWPPGPPLREAVKESSCSGMASSAVISTIVAHASATAKWSEPGIRAQAQPSVARASWSSSGWWRQWYSIRLESA